MNSFNSVGFSEIESINNDLKDILILKSSAKKQEKDNEPIDQNY